MTHFRTWMVTFALALVWAALPARLGRRANADESVSDPQIQMFLNELEPDFKDPKKPAIDGSRPVRGRKNAPVMLIEYSDFQCPYCAKGFEIVEELRKKYPKELAFVFKNLPLPFHPLALPAAKRFVAIALQSKEKAWKFHDQIFQNQQQFTQTGESWLDDLAKKLKVNVDKMKKDMEGPKVAKQLEADRKEAEELQFSGTPGFLVGGVRIKGAYPVALFEKVIERTLLAKKSAPKAKPRKKKPAPPEEAKGDSAKEQDKAKDADKSAEPKAEEKPAAAADKDKDKPKTEDKPTEPAAQEKEKK